MGKQDTPPAVRIDVLSMARLNEPTASSESIEALKRRFVRQNREIARVNSIQSLRIRSLESEVSHLLSENVSLREHIITLSQEIERFQAARLLHNGVHDIKTKLDNKLLELGGLVADLGLLPRKFTNFSIEQTKTATRRVSNEDLSDSQTCLGANPEHGEDGRLPVILEDRPCTRENTESHEVQGMAGDDLEVSQLCDLDISTAQTETGYDDVHAKSPEYITDTQDLDGKSLASVAYLPPNLETRRKRKPSPSLKGSATYDKGNHSEKDPGSSSKAGAKRKFAIDDDMFEVRSQDDDDFQFSRPACSPSLTHETFFSVSNDPFPVETQSKSNIGHRGDGRPKRKALEPKNLNIVTKLQGTVTDDPGQKVPTHTATNDKHEEKNSMSQSQDILYGNQNRPDDKPSPKIAEKFEPKEIEGGSNITEPDAFDAGLHMIPAIALTSQIQNGSEVPTSSVNAPSRSTRRQRSVVSYAEPNLRDKMRRPTNEFIAAVGDNQHMRRVSGPHPIGKALDVHIDECKSGIGAGLKIGDSDMEKDSGSVIRPSWELPSSQLTNLNSRRKRRTSPAGYDTTFTSHDLRAPKSISHQHWMIGACETEENSGKQHDSAEIRSESTKCQKAPDHMNSITKIKCRGLPGALVSHKQPRRHSSSTRYSTRDQVLGHDMSVSDSKETEVSPTKLIEFSECPSHDIVDQRKASASASEDAFQTATGLTGNKEQIRRGQRISTRRRSMML